MEVCAFAARAVAGNQRRTIYGPVFAIMPGIPSTQVGNALAVEGYGNKHSVLAASNGLAMTIGTSGKIHHTMHKQTLSPSQVIPPGGIIDMKSIWIVGLALFFLASPTFAQHIKRTPGRFDYYVLALSWQPAFCEFNSTTPECRSQNDSRYDATHLVLHGLWPNVRGDARHDYEYCGVAREIRDKDRSRSWCALPAPGLSEGLQKRLTPLMPGLQSCLERHEWFRHGVCSGLTADQYFEQATLLVEQVAKTKFSAYITSNIGKRVSLSSLLSEFDKDFGVGSSRSLAIRCDSKHGASMLTEIRLSLKKESLTASLSRESFVPAEASDKGSCKKQIAIDPVGLQTRGR